MREPTAQAIGVFPAGERAARPRLFDTLERAMAVSFPGRQPREHAGLAGAIVIGEPDATVDALVAAGVPCLVAPGSAPPAGEHMATVHFSDSSFVDERLRSQSITEYGWRGPRPLHVARGGTPLAHHESGVMWALQPRGPVAVQEVALPPSELGPGDRLKDHLCHSRFLGLLPLVHFAREVAGFGGWERPHRRACLVIDDPNLHWPSYGHVDFESLAAHASEYGYHVSIATVPIDAVFAHRRAVAVFRSSAALSLSMHGVDHLKGEMARAMTPKAAVAKLRRALRWVDALERRHDVAVDRVMIPPHGVISEPMMQASRIAGIEGIFAEGGPQGCGDPLTGWNPADLHLAGGLPLFHRLPMPCATDEIVLRGFLDQPVVLAGHHADAANLDDFAAQIAATNGAGDHQWMSLASLVRSNFLLRRAGTLLEVRAFSGRLRIDVPEGITRLVVRLPHDPAGAGSVMAVADVTGQPSPPVPVGCEVELADGGARRVHIQVGRPSDEVAADSARGPLLAWPVVRRCLSIGRDRIVTLVRRRGANAILAGHLLSDYL